MQQGVNAELGHPGECGAFGYNNEALEYAFNRAAPGPIQQRHRPHVPQPARQPGTQPRAANQRATRNRSPLSAASLPAPALGDRSFVSMNSYVTWPGAGNQSLRVSRGIARRME
jgi:hypothetical protein